MSALNDLGLRLVGSKPNDEGLCTYKLVDRNNVTIAETDEPGTGDDALTMARKFVEEMKNDDEK